MIGAYMSKFATLSGRGCCRFGCGLLGNIRRCRLEGVSRILQKLSSLVSELSVDFGSAMRTMSGILFLGRDNWSSKRLLLLLLARPPPLAKARVEILNDYIECYSSGISGFEILV